MVVVLTIGILASTAVTAFGSYQIRAKTTEASLGLSKIVNGEIEYFQKNSTFLAAGPINVPPSSSKVAVDFTTDTNWRSLAFGFADPIYFGYEASLVSATDVECKAFGDLNGNGITSLYQRSVTATTAGVVTAGGLYTFDELE